MQNPKKISLEQMERGDDDRKLSFSYDVGGEKLRLIDVSKEDDFLIDSPLFDSLEDLRLSVTFDGTNEHEAIRLLGPQSPQEGCNTEEAILQKEQNLSPSGAMAPVRPSYLRKSLAWDSAFFNSAGVLDPDELTFINRGLKVLEDMRMGKAEMKSAVNGSRKIDISHQNKNKTKQASQRHRIRRSEKTKVEHDSRREEASLKPPRASERMENLLRGQSISASLTAYDDRSATSSVRQGKNMMLCKKSALLNSCSLPSGSLSSPTFSSVSSISTNDNTVTLSPYDTSLSGSSRKVPSALVKGKTESRRSKLCPSTSTCETPPRLLKKSKELGHPRLSILTRSISNNMTCISPASSSDLSLSKSTSRSKQQLNELEAIPDTSVVWRTGLQSGALQGPNTPNISQRKSSLSLQFEEIKSPAQMNIEALVGTCPNSTEPRKKFKPSGLRQPSPKIGFFDEEKTMLAKANGDLRFQYEIEGISPYEYGLTNRKRPAKLVLDKTSPKSKTLKHSRESHLLQSAPGIKERNASSDKRLWNSSPRVSSTMKSWSDVALGYHTRKCIGTEDGICYKSRMVDARECDRKRVSQTSGLKGEDDQRRVKGRLKKRLGMERKGQRDDMKIQREVGNQSVKERNASPQTIVDDLHLLNEDKTRIPANWEDQVNDLSRYFDVVDLSKDVLMEFKGNKVPTCSQNGDSCTEDHVDIKSPFFDRKNTLDDQDQDLPNMSPDPRQSSLSITDILPSSRTPLADKNSICNRNGSFKSSVELTKGRLVAKASAVSSFEGIDKENI